MCALFYISLPTTTTARPSSCDCSLRPFGNEVCHGWAPLWADLTKHSVVKRQQPVIVLWADSWKRTMLVSLDLIRWIVNTPIFLFTRHVFNASCWKRMKVGIILLQSAIMMVDSKVNLERLQKFMLKRFWSFLPSADNRAMTPWLHTIFTKNFAACYIISSYGVTMSLATAVCLLRQSRELHNWARCILCSSGSFTTVSLKVDLACFQPWCSLRRHSVVVVGLLSTPAGISCSFQLNKRHHYSGIEEVYLIQLLTFQPLLVRIESIAVKMWHLVNDSWHCKISLTVNVQSHYKTKV